MVRQQYALQRRVVRLCSTPLILACFLFTLLDEACATYVSAGGRGFGTSDESSETAGTLSVTYMGGSGFGSTATADWSWETTANTFRGRSKATALATSSGNPFFPAGTDALALIPNAAPFPTITFDRPVRYDYTVHYRLEVDDEGTRVDSSAEAELVLGEFGLQVVQSTHPTGLPSNGVKIGTLRGSGGLRAGTHSIGIGATASANGYILDHAATASSQMIADVKFQPVPGTRGVFVGSTEYDDKGEVRIAGGLDANLLKQELSNYNSFMSDIEFYEGQFVEIDLLTFNYLNNPTSNSIDRIKRAVATQGSRLQKDDLFIFYFSGHGGGASTGDDNIHVQDGVVITDDQLTSWFDTPEWDQVNKLFILDSCSSGGFMGGNDDKPGESDLLGLPKTAVLAAATELNESLTPIFGDATDTSLAGTTTGGKGHFTELLLNALAVDEDGYATADENRNGLSFDEMVAFLNIGTAGASSYEGLLKTQAFPAPNDTLPQLLQPNFAFAATADFRMQMRVNGEGIPEPATLWLLALGGLAVARRPLSALFVGTLRN